MNKNFKANSNEKMLICRLGVHVRQLSYPYSTVGRIPRGVPWRAVCFFLTREYDDATSLSGDGRPLFVWAKCMTFLLAPRGWSSVRCTVNIAMDTVEH